MRYSSQQFWLDKPWFVGDQPLLTLICSGSYLADKTSTHTLTHKVGMHILLFISLAILFASADAQSARHNAFIKHRNEQIKAQADHRSQEAQFTQSSLSVPVTLQRRPAVEPRTTEAGAVSKSKESKASRFAEKLSSGWFTKPWKNVLTWDFFIANNFRQICENQIFMLQVCSPLKSIQ